MSVVQPVDYVLEPPEDLPAFRWNDWFDVPGDNPVVAHIQNYLWDLPDPPQSWETARLSKAVYLYREKQTQKTLLVKFYSAKVSSSAQAERYAANEFQRTQQAQSFGLGDGPIRAPRALHRYRDVLFLEYIDGLTLEDAIAIRRNRPGLLLSILDRTARLLAVLHSCSQEPDAERVFRHEIADARKYIDDLTRAGVLEGNPLVTGALLRLVDRWAADPTMQDYVPVHIHGDATTSNFIVPGEGSLVAIDWERMWIADPASDLGRLTAEVAHGIVRLGGNDDEAAEIIRFAQQAYLNALPPGWDREALAHRARFYRAASTLRICRNGWLPRLERMNLVAQAMALLI